MHDLVNHVRQQVFYVEKDLGPSITEQNDIVEGWWQQMAFVFNPNLHSNFIRDIPAQIITNFLVEKNIVKDEYNANQLYAYDIGRVIRKKELISYDDFMKIFAKRMFR